MVGVFGDQFFEKMNKIVRAEMASASGRLPPLPAPDYESDRNGVPSSRRNGACGYSPRACRDRHQSVLEGKIEDPGIDVIVQHAKLERADTLTVGMAVDETRHHHVSPGPDPRGIGKLLHHLIVRSNRNGLVVLDNDCAVFDDPSRRQRRRIGDHITTMNQLRECAQEAMWCSSCIPTRTPTP